MRVLLIDDIPDQVRKYQKVIKDLGHQVEAVDDSRLAEDLLGEEKFDAVISDVQMPYVSGYEIVYRIWAFKLDLPCLLHSSESRYSTGHEWIDLERVHEKFPFVTFHLKRRDVEPYYIKEFLDSLKN
ncbi:MAG: response regulator [Patescibacteria group bacterium]